MIKQETLDEMDLEAKNIMIELSIPFPHNFYCQCGCNVFSKYKDDDNHKYYLCHGCNLVYRGSREIMDTM